MHQLVIILLESRLLIIILAWLFLKCLRQITPLDCGLSSQASRLSLRIVSFYSGRLLQCWSAIGQLNKSVGVASCVSIVETFKGPFYQRNRRSEIALSLSYRYQDWCVDGLQTEGELWARTSDWMEVDYVMLCGYPHITPSSLCRETDR